LGGALAGQPDCIADFELSAKDRRTSSTVLGIAGVAVALLVALGLYARKRGWAD
jgi:hypothetical protein